MTLKRQIFVVSVSSVLLCIFSSYLAIGPEKFLIESFELVVPESLEFKLTVLMYGLLNFLTAVIVEQFVAHLVSLWHYDSKKYCLEL